MSTIDKYLVLELDTAALDSMSRGKGTNSNDRNTNAIEKLESAMENHGYIFRASINDYHCLPLAILLASDGNVRNEKAGVIRMHHIFIEANTSHLPYHKKHSF